jgi:mono/diheme cytochrome c family protein
MRWTRVAPIALVALSSAAVGSLGSCTQAQKQESAPVAMSPEQKVARGRYLATVAGCGDCHTPGGMFGAPDTTRLLAGSELGWKGPWGISFAKNLTPDPETGIGSWTEEQIVTAIQAGHRPDGSPIMPPMPWPDFATFTPEDASAVAAFLRSIPPVKHTNVKDVAPGEKYAGAVLEFPNPPTWDAPKGPPPGAPSEGAPPPPAGGK